MLIFDKSENINKIYPIDDVRVHGKKVIIELIKRPKLFL